MESMLRETEEEKKAEPEEEVKELEPAKSVPVNLAKSEQIEPSASLEKSKSTVAKPETAKEEPKPAKTGREYVVYANVNIPREEDFIFLVTALWHWYSKHTPSSLSLYSSPDEMEVKQVPPPKKEEPMNAKHPSSGSEIVNMEHLEAIASSGQGEEKKAEALKEEDKKEAPKEGEK